MVSTEELGDVFVLRVEAVRLDSAVGTIIRNAVVSKLENTKKFAVDIGNVKLVDSGGLGSLVAFLVGQIVDATIFTKLKEKTGDRFIWVRATGSTLVSQFIDSYIVLVIAFYLGGKYDLIWVLQVGTINYIYKLGMAICLLPLLYGVHGVIDRYLGIKQKPA